MSTFLPRLACILFMFASCVSTSRNRGSSVSNEGVNMNVAEVEIPAGLSPDSLTTLDRTQDGAFVLSPGFYEAEFKTYCLEPGTPDPSPRDAYLQSPVTGYRKDIIQSVLYGSRSQSDIKQKNVQLLLWSVVSRANYDDLSREVKADAGRLLTSKQIFELKGGWANVARTVSNSIPSGNGKVKRLFEMGTDSYEKFEKIAVLDEPSTIHRPDFNKEQWYKQKGEYYVRYFPVSYKSVRIQVYVPQNILDSAGKSNGEYMVFDPTGMQVIPANSNAQRLGVGGVLVDIIRKVIIINRENKPAPKRVPEKKKEEPPVRKKGEITVR